MIYSNGYIWTCVVAGFVSGLITGLIVIPMTYALWQDYKRWKKKRDK